MDLPETTLNSNICTTAEELLFNANETAVSLLVEVDVNCLNVTI